MTLPSSGAISLNDVNVELGNSGTAQISMNDAAVRGLFGVASGAISMSDGYGKSNVFAFTISSTQVNANLRSLAVAAGWDQSTAVEATIGSGVNINGSVAANSTAALTIDGSWPGGVTLINNGTITGRGGNGGAGAYDGLPYPSSFVGQAGGRAISASVAVTIDNQGTIAGGGGGGGGGGKAAYSGECEMGETSCSGFAGGGGGGGGRTNSSYTSSGGAAGLNTNLFTVVAPSAGNGGTSSAAGTGGDGGDVSGPCINCNSNNTRSTRRGGTGGDLGAAGSNGSQFNLGDGLGPSGGAAGEAVNGNSYITWTNTGTRLGTIV
jgi:hypothetical protein